MHRWQQKTRQKAHQSIIQNVKPTIKRSQTLNKSKQKHLSTSRSNQFTRNTTTANVPINGVCMNGSFGSFVKILELFHLEKYTKVMRNFGFPDQLKHRNSNNFVEDMLKQVEEDDQQRFLALMNTLIIMSKDIKKSNLYQTKKSSIQHIPKYDIHYTTKNDTNYTKNDTNYTKNDAFNTKNDAFNTKNDTNYVKNQNGIITKNEGHYLNKIDRSRVRPPIASQFRQSISINNTTSSKKTQKSSQIRIKQNTFKNPLIQSPQFHISSKFNISKPLQKSNQANRQRINIRTPNVKKKTPKKYKKNAHDDADIVHDFRQTNKGQPKNIMQSNKIIERLIARLQKIKPSNQVNKQKDDLNLQLDQIKKMYLSFDSATLTSNIGNIDLQQIIDCFVQSIYLLTDQQTTRVKKPLPIKSPFSIQNKQQIQYLLKQSLILTQAHVINPQMINFRRSRQHVQNQQVYQSLLLELPQGFNDKETKTVSISSQEDQDDYGFQCFGQQSFVTDFTCFDSNEYQDNYLDKKDLKNFVQLVVMAGKMEKQMPIIAFMYLKKLLNTKLKFYPRPRLTLYNWKNITLISLIQASKIWDDQSLQNPSFSKVLTTYTTYQLNRLQKYFLYFIDYKLTISQKQYCQGYFELRNHVKQANKTAHLMALDLKTIQILQKLKPGIKKKEVQLKQFYRKKMDKSF